MFSVEQTELFGSPAAITSKHGRMHKYLYKVSTKSCCHIRESTFRHAQQADTHRTMVDRVARLSGIFLSHATLPAMQDAMQYMQPVRCHAVSQVVSRAVILAWGQSDIDNWDCT